MKQRKWTADEKLAIVYGRDQREEISGRDMLGASNKPESLLQVA
jgi:hypothetical protein